MNVLNIKHAHKHEHTSICCLLPAKQQLPNWNSSSVDLHIIAFRITNTERNEYTREDRWRNTHRRWVLYCVFALQHDDGSGRRKRSAVCTPGSKSRSLPGIFSSFRGFQSILPLPEMSLLGKEGGSRIARITEDKWFLGAVSDPTSSIRGCFPIFVIEKKRNESGRTRWWTYEKGLEREAYVIRKGNVWNRIYLTELNNCHSNGVTDVELICRSIDHDFERNLVTFEISFVQNPTLVRFSSAKRYCLQ